MTEYVQGDFVPGRTFSIRGNMRRAIIVKTHEDNALWTWVCTDYEPTWDSIANIINACDWLGEIVDLHDWGIEC